MQTLEYVSQSNTKEKSKPRKVTRHKGMKTEKKDKHSEQAKARRRVNGSKRLKREMHEKQGNT
jgi:hypothetical protein